MEQSFIDLIKSRRSIRSFEARSVEKNLIEQIVQAGRFAPSAENKQPWKFIVVTNQNRIKDLSDAVKDQIKTILKRRFIYRWFAKDLRDEKTLGFLAAVALAKKDSIFFNAPVLIFIVTRKGLFNVESCSCCAENMMLAAHALDLGSCWIGFARFLEMNKKNAALIQLPKNHSIAAALVFGYPDKKPGKADIRRVDADIINWVD